MAKDDQIIKIIFLSDSHLGFDYPIKARVKRRRRGEDFFRNHNIALDYAKKINADLVLHGGDLFFRALIPEKIIARVYEELLDFAQNDIPIVIVPGNHERSQLPNNLFLAHPMIHIFNDVSTFKFFVKNTRVAISGFPYHRNNVRDSFPDFVNNTFSKVKSDIHLLLVHHAIENSTCGPKNFTFKHNEDVIQQKDINSTFDAVLSGHIHRQQVMWKKDGNKNIPIIYPGSVERTSFAEKDETKGFYELHLKKENDIKISNAIFHELPTRPMQTMKINFVPKDKQELENFLRSEFKKVHKDAIVRLKLKDESIAPMFSADLMRKVVPPTVNYQFKGGKRLFLKFDED